MDKITRGTTRRETAREGCEAQEIGGIPVGAVTLGPQRFHSPDQAKRT